MSHSDKYQPQVLAYPSKDPAPGPYPLPPPPVTDQSYPQEVPPSRETTESKGDGFWRGCCAGLCCYCCLDMCF